MTSHLEINRSIIIEAEGCLRSKQRLRLFLFTTANVAPPLAGRKWSPCGGSIFIIFAPSSASSIEQNGPERAWEKSKTFMLVNDLVMLNYSKIFRGALVTPGSHAAINNELCARDKASFVRCKENCGVSGISSIAHETKGNARLPLFQ